MNTLFILQPQLIIMKTLILQLSIKTCIIAAIIILNHSPMFSQGDTLISFWQGYYTPNIIGSNITVSNLTEGPGITAYDCTGGPYVYASGFDQGFDIDALNNGDYWEFSITPDPGFQLEVNYYEVQQRASHHPTSEMNTLGSLYWKIGSGNWIKSNITAGVQRENNLSSFCNNSSSRRPHQNTNFTTTETVTFRVVRWIYDNDNQMHPARITRNGYQWVSGFVTIALPVEFSKFEVHKQDQSVSLEWETVSETNNLGFEIERSSNGQSWDIIDFVEGNGTTTAINQYTFIDNRPLNGHNYYRLKQIDLDQQFSYSDIKEAMFLSQQEDLINIYPNPTYGHFTVSVSNPKKESARIKLFSSTGEVIWEQNFEKGRMESFWKKDFNLPKEKIYFLHTQIGKITETKKVLVIDKN